MHLQGQEIVAEQGLDLAAKEGHWVILQVILRHWTCIILVYYHWYCASHSNRPIEVIRMFSTWLPDNQKLHKKHQNTGMRFSSHVVDSWICYIFGFVYRISILWRNGCQLWRRSLKHTVKEAMRTIECTSQLSRQALQSLISFLKEFWSPPSKSPMNRLLAWWPIYTRLWTTLTK